MIRASDHKGLIAAAEKIKLIRNQTRWHDWERYSSRQKERMAFGGIVGEAEYKGPLGLSCPI